MKEKHMTLIEAAKQAREALVRADRISGYPNNKEAINALNQSIAEAEQQEPEAWDWVSLTNAAQEIVHSKAVWKRFIESTPLANDIACWMADFALEHTTPPPKREWQGLTKEECFELCVTYRDKPFSLLAAVQDKLKEKNT